MSLLASLRDWLTAQHLDAMLLSSRQNKQPHMGISSGSGFVFISHQSAHILVDARYYTDVATRTQGYQIHLLDGAQTLYSRVNHIIADEKLQTVGFEGEQVSWNTANGWSGKLLARLVSAVPDVLRQVKTAQEISLHSRSLPG
ncbi:MAG: Aminopeptidase [Citrobacter braakii]